MNSKIPLPHLVITESYTSLLTLYSCLFQCLWMEMVAVKRGMKFPICSCSTYIIHQKSTVHFHFLGIAPCWESFLLHESTSSDDFAEWSGCQLRLTITRKVTLLKQGFQYKKTFFSHLGVSYYLTKEQLASLIDHLFALVLVGSSLVLDYGDESLFRKKVSLTE